MAQSTRLCVAAVVCLLFVGAAVVESGFYVPVYVMLPLRLVNLDGTLVDASLLKQQLSQLKQSGADGVMTDVWWGAVERSPKVYTWGAYEQLFDIASSLGFKVQVVMSFHQCGGNVGDDCDYPLPPWVLQAGQSNPDVFFTDPQGHRDPEYISPGVDHQPVFAGRTALQLYSDFMNAFAQKFEGQLGSLITEVQVGLGPAGEMRYPSYQSALGFSYPGIGEFQMFDKYLFGEYQAAAKAAGHTEWGVYPTNVGTYNDFPTNENTRFFQPGQPNGYDSDYGKFFLSWYANRLIQHGSDVLAAARSIFGSYPVSIAAKVAGIHWWYSNWSHAAEVTAGYYNTNMNDAYLSIAKMFQKYNVTFDFTCLEMKNVDQNGCNCQSSPENLVYQTMHAAYTSGLRYSGENALPIYGDSQYGQIMKQAGDTSQQLSGKPITSFTYLRLSADLLNPNNFGTFQFFVQNMHNLL